MISEAPSANTEPIDSGQKARKRSMSSGVKEAEQFAINTPVMISEAESIDTEENRSITESHGTGRGRAVRGSESGMAKKRTVSTPPLLAFFRIFEIYKIFILLHRSDLKISTKKSSQFCHF